MRRNIQVVFVISALTLLVLCSACTSQPSGQKNSQEGGLTQVSVPVESPRISFEEAQQKLEGYWTTFPDKSSMSSEKIYYVLAKDVDESGNAASWIFGVKNSSSTLLLVYNGRDWAVIPWIITPLPSEIMRDNVVSPGKLFAQNTAIIISNSSRTSAERRDLELKEGVYTITITSGTTNRILVFNASTGALIS
jgi:hypothetical protein